jgi:hypothetical protein
LTLDEVRGWAIEREEALARIKELDRKLQGVRLLFPDLAAKLFGVEPPPSAERPVVGGRGSFSQAKRDAMPLYAKPITDVLLTLIEGENGGRPPRWFRDKMMDIPGLDERVERNANPISTALSRLRERGKLIKHGANYYLPHVFAQIQRGEIQEEPAQMKARTRGADAESFNSLMHKAMREHAKPFKAADAIKVAKRVPELREKLGDQPARVYSWLTREMTKNKLAREDGFYFYPSERDEAPNGNAASASVAGEGATSPIESQPTLRLIS